MLAAAQEVQALLEASLQARLEVLEVKVLETNLGAATAAMVIMEQQVLMVEQYLHIELDKKNKKCYN